MEQRIKRCMAIAVVVFCLVGMSACGKKDDSIKKETIEIVTEKSDRAVSLYQEIEGVVEDYALTADRSFTDMKQVLTDMSSRIKTGIQNTTEEDGQLTIQELNEMIDNLQEVKDKVSDMVKDMTPVDKSEKATEATATPTDTPEPTEEPEVRDLSDLE